MAQVSREKGPGRKRAVLLAAAVLSVAALLAALGFRGKGPPPDGMRVGYRDSPLLAPFYALLERPPGGLRLEPVRFEGDGDIGYALLSGEIDAGFVGPDKARRLLDAAGPSRLRVAGTVRFPYGAALVARKDLRIRLADLPGRKIAATEPDCVLFHQFRSDLRRLGVDGDAVRFVFLPADAMLPALEAGKIDGFVARSSFAVLAEGNGHGILYQNWEIPPGDECCPPVIAQVEYFLVVGERAGEGWRRLTEALAAASERPPAETREAVLRKLSFPAGVLARMPVSTFGPVTEELRKELGVERCVP